MAGVKMVPPLVPSRVSCYISPWNNPVFAARQKWPADIQWPPRWDWPGAFVLCTPPCWATGCAAERSGTPRETEIYAIWTRPRAGSQPCHSQMRPRGHREVTRGRCLWRSLTSLGLFPLSVPLKPSQLCRLASPLPTTEDGEAYLAGEQDRQWSQSLGGNVQFVSNPRAIARLGGTTRRQMQLWFVLISAKVQKGAELICEKVVKTRNPFIFRRRPARRSAVGAQAAGAQQNMLGQGAQIAACWLQSYRDRALVPCSSANTVKKYFWTLFPGLAWILAQHTVIKRTIVRQVELLLEETSINRKRFSFSKSKSAVVEKQNVIYGLFTINNGAHS